MMRSGTVMFSNNIFMLFGIRLLRSEESAQWRADSYFHCKQENRACNGSGALSLFTALAIGVCFFVPTSAHTASQRTPINQLRTPGMTLQIPSLPADAPQQVVVDNDISVQLVDAQLGQQVQKEKVKKIPTARPAAAPKTLRIGGSASTPAPIQPARPQSKFSTGYLVKPASVRRQQATPPKPAATTQRKAVNQTLPDRRPFAAAVSRRAVNVHPPVAASSSASSQQTLPTTVGSALLRPFTSIANILEGGAETSTVTLVAPEPQVQLRANAANAIVVQPPAQTIAAKIAPVMSASSTRQETITASAATPRSAPSITVASAAQALRKSLDSASFNQLRRRQTANPFSMVEDALPARIASAGTLSDLQPAAGGALPAARATKFVPTHPTLLLDIDNAGGLPPVLHVPTQTKSAILTPPPLSIPSLPAPTPMAATADLSPTSKKLLDQFPSQLDTPKKKGKQRIDITRENNLTSLLGEGNDSVASHESMGLKIEVKRPSLNVEATLLEAYDALIAGQNDVAIDYYQQVLTQQPHHEQALFGIATAYHRAGMAEQARPFYAALLKRNPTHRDALNNFLTLVAEESPNEALSELALLKERNPHFSPIPAQMAYIYQQQGQAEHARNAMMEAVMLAPENLTYRFNLAVLLDQQGARKEATSLYQELIEAHLRGEPIPGDSRKIQERLTFLRSNRG